MNGNSILVDVKNLKKYFPIRRGLFSRVVGFVKAVDNVDFSIRKGETLGLVGETGCGKTTTGRVILRLIEATAGSVFFDGVDLFALSKSILRKKRKEMQVIFQDPYSSLNPRMTVGGMLAEALKLHNIVPTHKLKEQIAHLLEIVGLSPDHARRYPHEFSGGQRQRIGIARALSVEPKFIVCDEPISALDVSIQAQIINLLQDLQEKFHLTYLFIAHDLSVVEHISNRVAVMYLGKIVEVASRDVLYNSPLHPYTEALLSAVPVPDPSFKSRRIILTGDVPSPANPPSGCYFHPRCRHAVDICSTKAPELEEISPGHSVSCHRAHELKLAGIGGTAGNTRLF
jgi:oligopeptide/dipeptide ABC transporter ATP-binding protein